MADTACALEAGQFSHDDHGGSATAAVEMKKILALRKHCKRDSSRMLKETRAFHWFLKLPYTVEDVDAVLKSVTVKVSEHFRALPGRG